MTTKWKQILWSYKESNWLIRTFDAFFKYLIKFYPEDLFNTLLLEIEKGSQQGSQNLDTI